MRLNGLRCDNCTKEHLFSHDITMQATHELLPQGWFMVVRGPYGRGDDTFICCSADCLLAWAHKQAIGQDQHALEVHREDLGTLRAVPGSNLDYTREDTWRE